MESETSNSLSRKYIKNGILTEAMTDGMVAAFESMVSHSSFEEAFFFIDVGGKILPTWSVVNTIVFKILMKNCEDKIACKAATYLRNVLNLVPSNNKLNYQSALQDQSGFFPDVWSVFTHLVMSCFAHHNITSSESQDNNGSEPLKRLNCNILIEFYTNVLIKLLPLKRYLFENENEERFFEFLGWINQLYKHSIKEMIVDQKLHLLLDFIVKSKVLEDESLPIAVLFNKDPLSTIVNDILKYCPDAFSQYKNLKKFCVFTELTYLQAKICQCQLDKLLNSHNTDKEEPLTLASIVSRYIFPASLNEKNIVPKCPKLVIHKTPTKFRPLIVKKPATDLSIMHEICRKERIGDLLEMIIKDSNFDINQKNNSGYTPLHEACIAKSYLCAMLLICEVKGLGVEVDCMATDNDGQTPLHCAAYSDTSDIVKLLLKHEEVDCMARDNDGRTPLHCAAYSGSIEIATLLLEHKDSELIMCEDNSGLLAIAYTKSRGMKKLLTKYEELYLSKAKPNNPLSAESLKAPSFKNKEDYSFYLYSLHILLCFYFDTFHLYKAQEKVTVSHKKSECPHYVTTEANIACDEDLITVSSLAQTIFNFLDCIKQDAQNSNLMIKLECIPLLIFAQSL